MPIQFNKELDAWETKDLTDDEKNALIFMATNMITDQLGAELAEKIVTHFGQAQMLKSMPQEVMGNA